MAGAGDHPRIDDAAKRLRTFELQDVKSGVVVGEVHHALRIDKAVCGLAVPDDLQQGCVTQAWLATCQDELARHQLGQQLDPLGHQLGRQDADTGEVTARPGETRDQA